LLKALIVDSEENMYLIKSIHQLLKKTINYYGTFICAPDIIVSFVEGIDFQSNTLLFFGDYLQLYEYINIYGETKTELISNNTYNNIETYLPLHEIYSITNAVLELPEIASMSDETQLDETKVDELIENSVNKVMQQQEHKIKELEQPDKLMLDTEQLHALGLNETIKANEFKNASATTAGGKNNRISNPKHNTKYRKNYKKFVSKYIIKKKKNNNKKNNINNKKNNNNKNNKNNKNKTKKNKRLTKSTPNTKRNNKTLKNKKGKSKSKSKSNNHKSKYNKKTKTNYYNYYRHNKTLKH
jgi:hypothetical protein